MSNLSVQEIEHRIINEALSSLIKAGFLISISYDGYEAESAPSADKKQLQADLNQCDEEFILVYKDQQKVGTILLVYGNDGHDVITDYTGTLEQYMKSALTLADSFQ